MAICRACLAEGNKLLQMNQDFVNKYNILTNLDIKPEETLYACQECSNAVQFYIEFRDNCIASNLAFKRLEEAKKETTGDEVPILIKEELKVEYHDCRIVIENYSDDDEITLSKLSAALHDEDVNSSEEEDSKREDKVTTKRKSDARTCRKRVAGKEPVKRVLKKPSRIVLTETEPCGLETSSSSSSIHDEDIELSEKENSKKEDKDTTKRKSDARTCRKRAGKELVKKVLKKALPIELTENEPCGLCPKTLKNVEDLKRHLGHHKVEVPCSFCPQHFIGLPHLYSHRIVHIPEEKRRCHLCNRMAWNIEHLEFHYMRAHNMADKDEPLRCKLCTKTTTSVKQMHRHMKNHAELKHKCKVCNKSYVSQRSLRLHAYVHNTTMLRCDKCDFITKSPKGLAYHQLRKHTEGRVYCKVCRRPFRNQPLCDKHKCRTTESIICSVCGFIAKDDKSYTLHKSVHDTVVRYKCELCPAKFRAKSSLRTHRDKHAGTPRQKCEFCERVFYFASVLIKHRRVHTGEKPYVCEVCNKGFTANHNLKVHMKIHGIYDLIKPKTAEHDRLE